MIRLHKIISTTGDSDLAGAITIDASDQEEI